MFKIILSLGACLSGLAVASASAAEDQGRLQPGLGAVATAGAPADAPAPQSFGPVPSTDISLVNVAPLLLTTFNNAPVFGLPGTVLGGLGERTQMTGDWGGARTRLARRGVFVDLYSTSAVQDITAGGLQTGTTFIQNSQLSLNVDSGRAGLWSGGLLHVTIQSRSGDAPHKVLTGGGVVPQYVGAVLPTPEDNDIQLSEFFVTQALGKTFGVVVGKISDVFIPDQTAFADSYMSAFGNFNFNKNPMTTNFYNPTAYAALGVKKITDNVILAVGVVDTKVNSENTLGQAFKYQNYYVQPIVTYSLNGLPGVVSGAYNWSNAPKLNLRQPYGSLAPSQIEEAVGYLVGSPVNAGLPLRQKDSSWFLIGNVSQYLFLKEDPASVKAKIQAGQPLRGLGVFGRVGLAPKQTNPITWDASLGLLAQGLMDARPRDSFGVAGYANGFSGDLKSSLGALSRNTIDLKTETGLEVFYNVAVTGFLHVIGSYQHVDHPLTGQALGRDSADILTGRIAIAF